jgi:hypothetical protein
VNLRTIISKYGVTSWLGLRSTNSRVHVNLVQLGTDMVNQTLRKTIRTVSALGNQILVLPMRKK